ncbi:MAG: S-layer homology domain-containing protein [Clostridia bacterium]|nr:S-layer homology domain-containing protein [Clostridia bacterium]
MKKFLTILLTAALLLQLTAGLCFAQEKEVVSLPAESKTWLYSINAGETATSDFVFSPALMTGVKLKYTTDAEAHDITLTIKKADTDEVLYSTKISVLNSYTSEWYLNYTHFETEQHYSIELTNPNETSVSGTLICAANESGYSDIPAENAALYEATRQLQVLGIFDGDVGTSFHPEATVTRGEMAKIIVAFLNTPTMPDAQSPYTDVDTAHPHYADICTATKLGIFCGHGDGTFKSEEAVTYNELLKITVHTLGYAPMAMDIGGYPYGYLTTAADLALTSGITITDTNRAATKADIALLLHNALTKPLMERTQYGSNAAYTIMDGKDGNPLKTILNTKF